MCFGMEETTDHVLLTCPFANSVWSRIRRWTRKANNNCVSIRDWLDFAADDPGIEISRLTMNSIWMATTWYIWLARNEFIFSSSKLSADKVVEMIMVNSLLWVKYRAKRVDFVWQN